MGPEKLSSGGNDRTQVSCNRGDHPGRHRDGSFSGGNPIADGPAVIKDLVVSETTVARAYEFLREQGQIEGKVGSGTYVRGPATNHHPNSFASLLPWPSTVEAAGSVQVIPLAPANAYLQRCPFADGLPFGAGLHFRTPQPGPVAGFRSPQSMASDHAKDGL